MRQSKLERASWIAGIASALIAVFALISTNRQVTNIHEIAHGTQKAQEQVTATEKSGEETRKETPLAIAINAAKGMNSLIARDKELKRLAYVAIERHEFILSLEAAGAMNSLTAKDEVLSKVSCYAAYYGEIEVAKSAVREANSLTLRDKMLRVISEVSSTEPGYGPNEPQCDPL